MAQLTKIILKQTARHRRKLLPEIPQSAFYCSHYIFGFTVQKFDPKMFSVSSCYTSQFGPEHAYWATLMVVHVMESAYLIKTYLICQHPIGNQLRRALSFIKSSFNLPPEEVENPTCYVSLEKGFLAGWNEQQLIAFISPKRLNVG